MSRNETNNKLLKNQRGASMPFVLVFLAMAAFVALVGFKLYPAYFEHWQLKSVVTSFVEDSQTAELDLDEINRRFKLRMQTNNIREIDFNEAVSIEKEEGVISFYLDYEVRINVYKNVDAVIVFDEVSEIYP